MPTEEEILARINGYGKSSSEDEILNRINGYGSAPSSFTSATGVSMPEPFYSKRLTPGQAQSFRSARTEAMRSEAQLRAIGKGDEVDEALQEHGGITGALETATKPIFDALNIFPQAIASGAIEYHRSGNSYRAFKQAASDFLDNLPGVDGSTFADYLPTPLNATFSDYLKEKYPYAKEHEWQAAGAGLVLDILLDPFTYTGVGLLSKLAKGKGWLKTAEAIEKATPMTAIKKAASLPGVSNLLEGIEKTGAYQGFGRRFIKDFEFKQLAKNQPELAVSIQNALKAESLYRTELQTGKIDVRDAVDAVYGSMSQGERRLFGAMLDQPNELKSLIRQVSSGDKDVEADLLNKMDSIIAHRNERGLADVKSGMLSEEAFRDRSGRYAPGMEPYTAAERQSSKDLLARMGVEPETLGNEIVPGLKVGFSPQIGQGSFAPGMQKTYNTLEERLLAGMPTELDAAIQDARRGFESVRYAASRRFADSVLSDPLISRSITEVKDAKILAQVYDLGDNAVKQLVEEYGQDLGWKKFSDAKLFLSNLEEGYGIYRPFRKGKLEPWQMTKDEFSKSGIQGSHKSIVESRIVSHGDVPSNVVSGYVDLLEKHGGEEGLDFIKKAKPASEPIYVLPKPFIDQLNYANKVMSNPDDLKHFMDTLNAVQGVWKGWALFSPGYHMRNMFSNFWNNSLAGVRNPLAYGEAAILQGMNPEKNPALFKLTSPFRLAKKPEDIKAGGLVGGEIMEYARKLGVTGTGMSEGEIGRSVERDLFRRMDDTNDALAMVDKVKPEGKGEFIRNVLETAPQKPGFASRQLGTDIEGKFSVRGFADALKDNVLLRTNRDIGSVVEDNAKIAHFITKLREGLSPEDAAMSVKKYLFDYASGLTDFEKNVMKFVAPFYSWMRFNIPLQVQSILENPGRYSALTGKPINAIESVSEDWKDIPTPDYFAEQHAVRLPRLISVAMEKLNNPLSAVTNELMDMTGSPDTRIDREGIQPEFINPNLPFQDLNRLNYRDMLSSLTPIAKILIEQVPDRGYSTFTDRPIEKYSGEPGNIPGLSKKWEAAISMALPPVGKAIRMIDRAKRGQLTEQLSTELLGIKMMGVDVGAVNRGKAYQRREKIRNLKQKYEDSGAFTKLPLVE